MAGIIVSGTRGEIVRMGDEYRRKREQIHRTCTRVSEDLLRKARDNAPVREGTLIGSGSARVTDRGFGRGFVVEVGFNTPYALRMHEAHYQAHDPHDKGRDKQKVTLRKRSGGIKVSQVIAKRTADGMWIDSAGRKHGRKYLTRAVDENMPKYKAAFGAIGDK